MFSVSAVTFFLCITVVSGDDEGSCSSVQLVTRKEWGARPPVRTERLSLPVNMTFIHHSAGVRCYSLSQCSAVIRTIQDYHMDKLGWFDIGYNFLIGDDGRVYEGRGWQHVPAHSPRYNYISHGLCFLGNFMKATPRVEALEAARAWIRCGVDKMYITPNYELFGHRDGRCTKCPGDELYREIQTWPHYSRRHIPVICTTSRSQTPVSCRFMFILSFLVLVGFY